MKQILRYFFVTIFAMVGLNVNANVTDELTWDKLLAVGSRNSYVDFSGKTVSSNAVYAGNASSGTDQYIQLRTNNNNSGIITTATGGKIISVTIAFNSKTTDRKISIYGSNDAYTAASDLYDEAKCGTKLGDIAANDNNLTLTVQGDYKFIGLRSENGAIYVDKITIVWDGEPGNGNTQEPTIKDYTIGEFIAIADNEKGILKLTDAIVLGTGNNNHVLSDATGAILIYDKNLSFTQGRKVNGTITGTKVTYGGVPELKNVTDKSIVEKDGSITPTTIAATELVNKNILTGVYRVEAATVAYDADAKRYFIMNGDTKVIMLYDEFKAVTLAEGTYNIEGIRGKYNDTDQFWVTSFTVASGIQSVKMEKDDNATIYNLAGQKVDNSYKGLIIKNGKKMLQK